jgi:thymidylate kinase
MATMDNDVPNDVNRERLTVRSEQAVVPKTIKKLKIRLRRLVDQGSFLPDKILLASRVIIIEGISGSGKDTFQTFLKTNLKGREIYDFSEGELLHSWKHIPIEGVLKLKVEFMRIFVDYLYQMIGREQNSVFLLNRFHLSTYASIKTRQPELMSKYDKIIKVLRRLPVHVFILTLDEKEIEQRSSHSERSGVWPKLQQQMITNDGFRNRVEKYLSQQSLMIEGATNQRIPYSVFNFLRAPENELASVDHRLRSGVSIGVPNASVSHRKRELPRSF